VDWSQNWNNFFMAEIGAAAALVGLLFISISINLTRILKYPHLPTRAAEALVTFSLVLVVGSFGLVPGQSVAACGWEIGGAGLLSWALHGAALFRTRHSKRPHNGIRIVMNQLPSWPFIIAGAWMIAGHAEGLYWTVPGVLLCFLAGLFSAWVLLIEIQR
jgi:hypothetical protein